MKSSSLTAICVPILTCVIAFHTNHSPAQNPLRDSQPTTRSSDNAGQLRVSENETQLRAWLENMVWHHRYTSEEIASVTGLSEDDLRLKLRQLNITPDSQPPRRQDKIFVLPYPGGRHPRIGFLDGAIAPQRETKLSAFCPWDPTSYAVIDVPEAIWSNLGLTYLAHTHIDTIWTRQNVRLEQLEWEQQDDNFQLVRKLPNGIEFGVKVIPLEDHLRMKMWLTNGTDAPLGDLRVQNCVMLKAMEGFNQQHNENKQFKNGYAVCHDSEKARWIITAWDPPHRSWGNVNCPCLHSDPKFPDCAPGETQWLRGWFSFYEGPDIDRELARIEATGWRTHPLHHVTGNLVGKVIDAETGQLLPCRLYVENTETGSFHFARSTAVAGSAVIYDKQLRSTDSLEKHTTLSADGFQLDLPPGRYRLTAFHGKEYVSASKTIEIGSGRSEVTLSLQRMLNMAQLGWYSGDTHVHRTMEDLPNVILAEDVNIALPLNYWVRDSRDLPSSHSGPQNAAPVRVDQTHLIYPINTEYEIFTVDGKRHTQGAVFVLNHQSPIELPAPPVSKLANEARRQGAILDLDKHSWNWSVMVVPLMNVDLFELSNNHHWRTEFGFPQWTVENAPVDWPEVELATGGFTESSWTEFGFQTYYRFLNCGFRMRVSAGTASGVHPVPLGHGRVYVHTGQSLSYPDWIQNLNAGHSFVTQGPLMNVRFNGELPGTQWTTGSESTVVKLSGTIDSVNPLNSVEVIVNGEIAARLDVKSERTSIGSYRITIDHSATISGSGWLALRCFEEPAEDAPSGKVTFAHTNPVFVDVPDQPLRPRRKDIEYFIQRMEAEIARNQGILSEESISEFRQAKAVYELLLDQAQD